jgi:hypothetical protein
MRASFIPLLLIACSETGLSISEEPDVPDEPVPPEPADVAVTPGAVDLGVVCGGEQAEVTVANVGGSPLTVLGLEIGGAGWSATLPQLPAILEPAASLAVPLRAGDGEGTLRVVTDDPETPTIDVPLSARQNTPPTLAVTPPDGSWILAPGGTSPLVAAVVDPDQPAAELTTSWTSSVDGPLGDVQVGDDGTAVYGWVAEARTVGPHDLTVEVVDACDARATLTVPLCQNQGYIADELDLRSWNFEGSARWDTTRDVVSLTPASLSQAGTAFQTSSTIDASNVDIRFRFYMGGGTGADGLSLTVLDAARMTSFVGELGGGIGYAGLPGFSVEVDTYFNGGVDPTSAHHVSLHLDGNQGRVIAWAALPKMDDARWHDMRVTVDGDRVVVEIDGTVHLDTVVADLAPFEGYIGFTGATGALTNEHLIDALRVERFVCDEA